VLAEAALVGVPVDRLIRSRDSEEVALLHRVRAQGAKLLDEIMTDLARRIVKEQADAEERGRKKNKGK